MTRTGSSWFKYRSTVEVGWSAKGPSRLARAGRLCFVSPLPLFGSWTILLLPVILSLFIFSSSGLPTFVTEATLHLSGLLLPCSVESFSGVWGGEVLSEAFALSCNVATHGVCRRVVVVS